MTGSADLGAQWATVILTAVLAAVTAYYTNLLRQQRADAWLPLLHVQEPFVRVACDWNRSLARIQVHLVLRNVGPGAARIRLREATSPTAAEWQFPTFAEPSIIPSQEPLILQLYADLPLDVSLDNAVITAPLPLEARIVIQYEDVVERRNYQIRPSLKFSFGGLRFEHRDVPDKPEHAKPFEPRTFLGEAADVVDFDPDARPASARRVPRDANPPETNEPYLTLSVFALWGLLIWSGLVATSQGQADVLAPILIALSAWLSFLVLTFRKRS